MKRINLTSKLAWWVLLCVTVGLPLTVQAQYPACVAARFLDWKDFGCNLRGHFMNAMPDLPIPGAGNRAQARQLFDQARNHYVAKLAKAQ